MTQLHLDTGDTKKKRAKKPSKKLSNSQKGNMFVDVIVHILEQRGWKVHKVIPVIRSSYSKKKQSVSSFVFKEDILGQDILAYKKGAHMDIQATVVDGESHRKRRVEAALGYPPKPDSINKVQIWAKYTGIPQYRITGWVDTDKGPEWQRVEDHIPYPDPLTCKHECRTEHPHTGKHRCKICGINYK